ncbi:hypothetical protein K0B03_03495 [Patescibacteria group bacterium]|nr:hypothetical protein [Patescibacteria group bacterium]
MSFLIAIFLFLLFLIIIAKVGEYQKERKRIEFWENEQEESSSELETTGKTKINFNKTIVSLLCVTIIIFLLALIYVGLTGEEDYQIIKLTGSNGDASLEVYNYALNITEVKSNTTVSIIFKEIVKEGMTTFSFDYQGKGEVEIMAYPLVNNPSVKLPINPPHFLPIKLDKKWNIYKQGVYCKQDSQIVLTLKIPKGGEAHIKNVQINTK